ncbi:MAG: type I-E CRISPR-associated protein Cas6/Cse3/CasE [Propionibacteriaceae bacterium]|nr:type I-E CRISPR-associated protein Cas6/Cse3/CasE [Propionibacteriaceae bacterium]
MFLTEFPINSGRRSARLLLGSPQRIHGAVLGCFPPGQHSDESARCLWRLERRSGHDVALLIASPLRPDLTALNETAGWTTGVVGRSADYGPFLSRLAEGQQWRFRLVANPVHNVPVGGSERTKRLAHVTVDQQLGWLNKRAEKNGFTLGDPDSPTARVTGRETVSFDKGAGEGRHKVTLARAQFDGVLVVRDADLLRHALCFGIGKAKSYGCGLLTLAPGR